MNLILVPIVTEKALQAQGQSRYQFWVPKNATKPQIRQAFKSNYSLLPVKIATQILKGKVKTDPRHRQKIIKSDRKKAIITVPKGQKIDSLILKKK